MFYSEDKSSIRLELLLVGQLKVIEVVYMWRNCCTAEMQNAVAHSCHANVYFFLYFILYA